MRKLVSKYEPQTELGLGTWEVQLWGPRAFCKEGPCMIKDSRPFVTT